YNDIPKFFEGLLSESPRMAAILAAAAVEDGLEYAIEVLHMPRLSKTEFATIFDSDDMLGTFGAKIKFGHALRIYGDLTQADLNCSKDLRNVFAHAKMHLDFEHPLVKEACTNFHGPFIHSAAEKNRWSAQERFMATAQYLYLDLLGFSIDGPRPPELP